MALVAGLWLTRRNPRSDLVRAGLLLFGGSLLVTGLVFSEMKGTIHPYYTVALAPATGTVIAITGRELWLTRRALSSRVIASALIAVTAWWDIHLLDVTPTFLPWLRYAIAVTAAAAIFLVLLGHRLRTAAAGIALVATLLAALGGSAAYAIDTASKPQTAATWQLSSGKAVMAIGGFTGSDNSPTLAQFQTWVTEGKIGYFIAGGGMGGGFRGGQSGGTSSQISTWVAAHFTAKTVGGTTIYDLTAAATWPHRG